MVNATFIGSDQYDEKTTYWFRLTGTDYGTKYEFDGDVYGIMENIDGESVVVNSDNCALVDGDYQTVAVRNSITITAEIREA